MFLMSFIYFGGNYNQIIYHNAGDDYLVHAAKQGRCEFSESADNMFSNFNHVRKMSDDGIGKLSDFIGELIAFPSRSFF